VDYNAVPVNTGLHLFV